MKAVFVRAPHQVELVDVAKPEITADDEVIIAVRYGGICGSDVGIYTGSNALATYPRIIGHEFSGVIEAIGAGVSDLKVGDLVAVDIVNSCGHCYACRSGHQNVCRALSITGVHRDGGFAEFYKAKCDKVYPLNKEKISASMACMVEPFSVGAEVNARANVVAGDKVLVMGAGPAGLTIMQTAKARGAEVMITDIFPERLVIAKQMGATRTVNVKQEDLAAAVAEFTDGEGPYVIADAVCSPQSVVQALDLLAPAGRFVVLGTSSTPVEIPQIAFTKKGINVFGTRVNNHRFPEVIAGFEKGVLTPNTMHTDTYKFSHIDDAFERLKTHKNEVCKILLEW